MNVEIERKFLVSGPSWIDHVEQANSIVQWYIHTDDTKSIRVRLEQNGAILCIKSLQGPMTRNEHHVCIPETMAMELLRDEKLICGKIVSKIRHIVMHDGNRWEIDQFTGDNAGLVVAEIELKSEDQAVKFPQWIGEEITMDQRYLNSSLALLPYKEW